MGAGSETVLGERGVGDRGDRSRGAPSREVGVGGRRAASCGAGGRRGREGLGGRARDTTVARAAGRAGRERDREWSGRSRSGGGRRDLGLDWNYFASFLDEFVQRELIAKEKEEDFKGNYKDPDEFCCLFVIDKEFTRFVFIPYPED